ncbi:N-acetylmuramoyl-L-alanine amidase [Elgaria multicarinata webbii]|uniref:N-acetylmuramoyl-L-alanine amidase n=1 Tax=Elgaria multicarinata webbii TaxID=159646 RepID=UPI002FCCFFC0
MFLKWLGLVPVLFCASVDSADKLSFHMDSMIGILEDLEFHLRGTPELIVTTLLQGSEFCTSEVCQFFLGPVPSLPLDLPYLSEVQRAFLKSLVNHKVDNSSLVERGVLLTADGTTVALTPLLAGITAGSQQRHELAQPATAVSTGPSNSSDAEPLLPPDPLFATTIATELGIASLLFHNNQSQVALGPNGCWDNISTPHQFALMGPPSQIPDAFINGAMDGLILGMHVAWNADPPPSLSALLRAYYGGEGLEGQKEFRSNFRRKNFAVLVSEEKLRKEVESSLRLLWSLNDTSSLFDGITSEALILLVNQTVEEFMALYVECPAMIPRCMWGARPYRGTPTQLQLPLGFVYIHHTSTPSKPCRNFSACAANMRSMQRFHQDVRGWDDIGYSFVFGSDGYLYHGRGWHLQGAHTKGYNSKGFGISFIGDYMKVLPEAFDLELMKNNFLKCAIRGSRLQANYTIYGHRQMKPTLCPGDRLFQEIETWKGFKVRCFMDKGVHHCI